MPHRASTQRWFTILYTILSPFLISTGNDMNVWMDRDIFWDFLLTIDLNLGFSSVVIGSIIQFREEIYIECWIWKLNWFMCVVNMLEMTSVYKLPSTFYSLLKILSGNIYGSHTGDASIWLEWKGYNVVAAYSILDLTNELKSKLKVGLSEKLFELP